MAFQPVKPYATKPKWVPGFRMRACIEKAASPFDTPPGQVAKTSSHDVAAQYFGGSDKAMRFHIAAGQGKDFGKLLITAHADGAVDMRSTGGQRAANCLKLQPWPRLRCGKYPSALCEVIDAGENSVTLRLPSWARTPEGELSAKN